jgi:WD40 repeat protein
LTAGTIVVAARLAAADDAARLDRYGDPLPEGAVLRLGTSRLRPAGGDCWGAAFSPDGKVLATIGINSSPVSLWDMRTGKLLQQLEPSWSSQLRPRGIAFSPDGKELLAGQSNGDTVLWEVETGRELRLIKKAHDSYQGVVSVAFAPDGKAFATGGEFGWVYVWDAATGEKLQELQAGEPAPADSGGEVTFTIVVSLAFSPDGRHLAGAAGNQPSHGFAGGPPDARLRAIRNPHGESIAVWDSRTWKRVRVISNTHGTEIAAVGWTADGKQIISGGNRLVSREQFGKPYNAKNVRIPEVKLWDVETGKLSREWKSDEPEAGFGALALSRDGQVLASGGEPAVRLWDVASGKLRRRIDVPGWWGQSGLALSPDGKAVVADHKGAVGIWDVETRKPLLEHLQSHGRRIISIACSADGARIYTGSEDGTVRCWDAGSGAPLFVRALGKNPGLFTISLTGDEKVLAAGGLTGDESVSGAAVLWNAGTGAPLSTIRDPAEPYVMVKRMAFSRDGRLLAVSKTPVKNSNSDEIDIWDLESGRKQTAIRPAEFSVNMHALAFSPDRRTLYSVPSQPGVVSAWDVSTGDLKDQFLLDEGATEAQQADQNYRWKVWISDARFAPDTKRVIVSRKQNIVIWDLETKRLVRTFETPGHNMGRVIGLSADGRLLATGDLRCPGEAWTDIIRVWDLEAEKEPAQFESTDGMAASLAFTADGKRVISGTERGTALVFELPAVKKD